MLQTIAIFLLTYVGYNYFDPLINITRDLPKPLSCGSCMSFWLCGLTGVLFIGFWAGLIAAPLAYLTYQLIYKYI